MIAKYKNDYYAYVKTRQKMELITNNCKKSIEGFGRNKSIYFKEISIENNDLVDVFDLHFLVKVKLPFQNVPNEWKILLNDEFVQNSSILLRFVNGHLPGWKIEDKNISSTYIETKEVEGYKAVFNYYKREGIILDSVLRVEQTITKNEFFDMFDMFSKGKI